VADKPTRRLIDELTDVIEDELTAQVAIGRLGKIDPTGEQVRTTAGLLADIILIVFKIEKRPKPSLSFGEDD
jgi:hypothetical protein